MDESTFISKNFKPKKGRIVCESPSNIALIKYWGKYGLQFPINPSLSFTLSNCKTITSIEYSPRLKGQELSLFFYMMEKQKNLLKIKLKNFLREFPFLSIFRKFIFKNKFKKHFSSQ